MFLAYQSTVWMYVLMKINTQGRYALIALIDLASKSVGLPVSLSEIAERQNISLAYLEQLFTKLRRAGIVTSYRGASGGYTMAKSPESLRISEILSAVDEMLGVSERDIGKRGNGAEGRTFEDGLSVKLWEQLSATIYVFLHQMRLSDILNDQLTPCPAVPHFVVMVDDEK